MSENKNPVELVEIVKESGIEQAQATPLINKFGDFYNQAISLTAESKGIVIKDISQVEDMKKSRAFRLKLKSIRNDADKIRIAMKEPFLRGANAVQAAYNGVEKITKEEEKRLEEQEKYIERLEQKRIDELEKSRKELLSQYCDNVDVYSNLGQLAEDGFNELVRINKVAHEAKIAAEKKAEEERIEQENKNKILRDRQVEIAPYLEFLPKDIDPKTAYCRESHDYKSILSKAIEAKKKHDKEIWELKILAEKNNKAREKAEAELKEQQEAIAEQKRKEEAEIKANEEAAKKIKAQEEELQRKKLLAPDKEKLNDLAKLIEEIQLPAVSSNEAGAVIRATKDMLGKVTNYIREKAKTL
jgi:hypothetical protein